MCAPVTRFNDLPEERAAALKILTPEDIQGMTARLWLCLLLLSSILPPAAALREICASHELTERDIVEQAVPIVNLEMFLFNFPKVHQDCAATS